MLVPLYEPGFRKRWEISWAGCFVKPQLLEGKHLVFASIEMLTLMNNAYVTESDRQALGRAVARGMLPVECMPMATTRGMTGSYCPNLAPVRACVHGPCRII